LAALSACFGSQVLSFFYETVVKEAKTAAQISDIIKKRQDKVSDAPLCSVRFGLHMNGV
jgi:hypothetical protein